MFVTVYIVDIVALYGHTLAWAIILLTFHQNQAQMEFLTSECWTYRTCLVRH